MRRIDELRLELVGIAATRNDPHLFVRLEELRKEVRALEDEGRLLAQRCRRPNWLG